MKQTGLSVIEDGSSVSHQHSLFFLCLTYFYLSNLLTRFVYRTLVKLEKWCKAQWMTIWWCLQVSFYSSTLFSRKRVLQNKELLGQGNSIFNKLLINIHNSASFKLNIYLNLTKILTFIIIRYRRSKLGFRRLWSQSQSSQLRKKNTRTSVPPQAERVGISSRLDILRWFWRWWAMWDI